MKNQWEIFLPGQRLRNPDEFTDLRFSEVKSRAFQSTNGLPLPPQLLESLRLVWRKSIKADTGFSVLTNPLPPHTYTAHSSLQVTCLMLRALSSNTALDSVWGQKGETELIVSGTYSTYALSEASLCIVSYLTFTPLLREERGRWTVITLVLSNS